MTNLIDDREILNKWLNKWLDNCLALLLKKLGTCGNDKKIDPNIFVCKLFII